MSADISIVHSTEFDNPSILPKEGWYVCALRGQECDACEHEGPSRTFCEEPEQFEGPSVGVMLPAQGANGRLFTPRISGTSTLRLPMQLSDADHAKISRGRPWQAFVTDQNTGKRYQVIGAECEAGPHCFCDAVIVERVAGGKP